MTWQDVRDSLSMAVGADLLCDSVQCDLTDDA